MGTAIYTGVTGLQAHQRRIDVVANNIANVNTTGYRGSRVVFQDLFSQTIEGARGPDGSFGGTNPSEVGLGVRIASIDVNHVQGSLVTTGVSSDLAIQGSGFFVLSDGTGNTYTRDGSFALNANGVLVDPATGMSVQGYMADGAGNIDTNTAVGNITIPVGGAAIVRSTENANLQGNLNSSVAAGTSVERMMTVYDSQGTPREVTMTFTMRDPVTVGGAERNAWDWSATYTDGSVPPVVSNVGSGTVLFDTEGAMVAEGTMSGAAFTARAADAPEIAITNAQLGPQAAYPNDPFEFNVQFNNVTNLVANSDVTVSSQDGYPRGTLSSFNIGKGGVINGVFTNGLTAVLGQVAVANFSNVGGLSREGNNMFRETAGSGVPQIGLASEGGRGQVSGGVLEGSNVDLGTEFSNLIVTQRGFQANARTITTADTLMQETVNLVR
ncbi:MAG: flagellar hook protein FlgE [FCB group bacterium]|jgi:flagellar hook protein FlgE|nr:flagellar hook protein FlgE [FCB group bacterium]